MVSRVYEEPRKKGARAFRSKKQLAAAIRPCQYQFLPHWSRDARTHIYIHAETRVQKKLLSAWQRHLVKMMSTGEVEEKKVKRLAQHHFKIESCRIISPAVSYKGENDVAKAEIRFRERPALCVSKFYVSLRARCSSGAVVCTPRVRTWKCNFCSITAGNIGESSMESV
jgi:hypothetical protein